MEMGFFLFLTRNSTQRAQCSADGDRISLFHIDRIQPAVGHGKFPMADNHCQAIKPLAGYLDEEVFRGMEGVTLAPDPADVAGFEAFAKRYVAGLPVVREAVRCMKE